MTDAELKQQPRSVREEFENITDREVDGDLQLSTMRSDRDHCRGSHSYLPWN